MAFIKEKCDYCGKPAVEKSSTDMGHSRFISLECGHAKVVKKIQGSIYDLESTDGRKLYAFQKESIKFIEESDGRCLIAHEMGLGKTVISLGYLKLHPEAMPTLIVCKSALMTQYFHETVQWTGQIPQMIRSSSDPILKQIPVHLISYDLIGRGVCSECAAPKRKKCVVGCRFGSLVIEKLSKIGYKSVLLDECQQIKSSVSNRTNAVRRVTQFSSVEYIIATSGTPIKNNAVEYFPILNILKPNKFNSHQGFVNRWVSEDWDGYRYKWGGIKDYMVTAWQDYTRDFITRKTRAEVMPDLPTVKRNFRFDDLGENVEDAYRRVMQEFCDEMDDQSKSWQNKGATILGYMNKMRHLTGVAKVERAVALAEDFYETDPSKKIVFFVHHHDVHHLLEGKLKLLCAQLGISEPLSIRSGDDGNRISEQFRTGDNRFLIASTIAAGEGLNLQFCHDAVLVERQYNPANEEQCETRFTRIWNPTWGPDPGMKFVDMTYLICYSTIDEFFTNLVEQKRTKVKATLDGEVLKWDESSVIRELAEILNTEGRKKWLLHEKAMGL